MVGVCRSGEGMRQSGGVRAPLGGISSSIESSSAVLMTRGRLVWSDVIDEKNLSGLVRIAATTAKSVRWVVPKDWEQQRDGHSAEAVCRPRL